MSGELSAMCSTEEAATETQGFLRRRAPLPESRPGHRARRRRKLVCTLRCSGPRTTIRSQGYWSRSGGIDEQALLIEGSYSVLAAEILVTTPVGAAERHVVDSQLCIGGPVRDMLMLSGSLRRLSKWCDTSASAAWPARCPGYLSRCRCRRSSVCGTAMNGRYRGLLRPAHGCRRPHAMPGGSHLARLIRAR